MISAYIPGISWYISDIKILIFWPVPGPWLSAIPSSVEALIASGLLATQGAPAQALQKCLGWIPNAHMNDHGISWLLTLDHDWNRSCAGPVCFADENTSGPFEAKYASLPILRDACDGPRFETDKDELVQVGKLRYIYNCKKWHVAWRIHLWQWSNRRLPMKSPACLAICTWAAPVQPTDDTDDTPRHAHTVSNTVLQSPAGSCEVSEARWL